MASVSDYQPIAPLPPEEVHKICAGEVVERPLSVVKELVENALDAGATAVTIELQDGGKQLIRVSDNGWGIPYDELPLALRPHHTSKIRCLNDLYALTTLGFRGEALSSIAAVARVTLSSRRAGTELGGRVSAAGGEAVELAPCNVQAGTEVEVRDLFFNTPVRLKFLKSRQAETALISGLMSAYALARPEVRFKVLSGGRAILATDAQGGLRSVLTDLLGPECGGELAEINFEFPPAAAYGFISEPRHHRHNRTRQWYFVNHRPVVNKLLYKAVDDAVREFLSAGKYPMGAFFVELPPEEVDVNVHPMKSEVNFAQPQAVYSLLATAVRRALGEAAAQRQRALTRGLAAVISPAAKPPAPASAPPRTADDPSLDPETPPGQRAVPLYEPHQPIAAPPAAPPLASGQGSEIPFPGRSRSAAPPHLGQLRPQQPSARPAPAAFAALPDAEAEGLALAAESSEVSPEEVSTLASELGLGVISQISDTYLVVTTPQAVYLIDQHAAHERVLFEELYAGFKGGARASAPARQCLLFPMVIPLSGAEAELAEDYLPALEHLGFACELGAAGNLLLREVPQALAGVVTPELLHGMLAELAEHQHSALLESQVKELAAALACHAAVKANQPLPPDERFALVRQLLTRLSSLSCPHGRPTVLRLGSAEMARLFMR